MRNIIVLFFGLSCFSISAISQEKLIVKRDTSFLYGGTTLLVKDTIMKLDPEIIIGGKKIYVSDTVLKKSSKKKSWFSSNVSIRRTFDGSKSEQKPATINYQEDFQTNTSLFQIDIAAKISEFEWAPVAWFQFISYPKIEWHKTTKKDAESDKYTVGANTELYLLPKALIKPWFLFNISLKRNVLEDVNEQKYAMLLSAFSTKAGLPGGQSRINNKFFARYYPYVGFEYYEIPEFREGQNEQLNMFLLRFFVELWPYPDYLQWNNDIAYRTNLDDESLATDNPILFVSTLNYYPSKKKHFSLGLEYKSGEDPKSNFMCVRQASVKLNYKL